MNQAPQSAIASDELSAITRPLERVIGKRSATALAKLGLHTVRDLLLHVPFRLAQRGQLMPLDRIREGESVTVVAQVMDSQLRPMNNRRGFLLTISISDGEHDLDLTFFGKTRRPLAYHQSQLDIGTVATFSGTISAYRGRLQLTHPEYELLDDPADVDPEKIARPIPIYHSAQKVPSWHISRAIDTVLATLTPADIPDPIPQKYRELHNLPDKFTAITSLHHPENTAEFQRARIRMKHEEALVLQAVLAQRTINARQHQAPQCQPRTGGILEAFNARIPFSLTTGQRAVGEEIATELATSRPMRRLLQGDVGAGKTIVALRAMLQAVDAGYQAVLIAPTEVLAYQHLTTMQAMLGELGQGGTLGAPDYATTISLLIGSLSAPAKRQALQQIASGEPGLIIGTHALLQDAAEIPNRAIVVIDEQHRFGVDQRDRLAHGAHMLVMTATPIPRTIAMTSFGDLDVSTLTELPAGRQPIATTLVPATNQRWMERLWQRAREEIDAGGRVYVVCPRISATETEEDAGNSDEQDLLDVPIPSEKPRELASVEQVSAWLANHPALNGITIGILHGQLPPESKTHAMSSFTTGDTPLLVTTTVIEVGVDVPEATMMIILDADRFGLAQLHQLRGRIGRGNKPSICLAVSHIHPDSLAGERLAAFASTTNGFELAERDVELRSEGDVLGARQSGTSSSLRFLKVTKDGDIITAARQAVHNLFTVDPGLETCPQLRHAIETANNRSTEYLEKG
ncbi:MAG: ATP-dependent DNA helicase RecG [Actinomycetaceae bacterium]|nr:ATP-dependent DNA helicase RecG [Actinomycetaceae bacterium]